MRSAVLRAARFTILPRSLQTNTQSAARQSIRPYAMSAESKSKTVLVPIANGSEEIEAVCIIDVLRRAGADVTVASVESETQVTASRKTKLVADKLITECKNTVFDGIFLPGGMPGAERLRDSSVLIAMLKKQASSGRLFGAVCASPAVALEPHGLLRGHIATSHPSFHDKLSDKSTERVVVSKNCVTSQSPGTSLEFALQIVALLYGDEHARKVAAPMFVNFKVPSVAMTAKL